MRYSLILLFVAFLALKANSQSPTFLDSTAVWNMEISFFRDFNSPPPIYHTYQLSDSLQIGNYGYQGIRYSGPFGNSLLGYLREVGSKVYMRLDSSYTRLTDSIPFSTEFLVYDFTLQLGDTIPLRIYSINSSEIQKTFYYTVTQIDSLQVLAGKRKRLVLRHLYPQDSGWAGNSANPFIPLCLDSLNWIEGIGSDFSPIYNIDASVCALNGLSPFSADFIKTNCHSKNGQLLYQPFGACENISLPETKSAVSFSVYPNPAKDFVELKTASHISRIRWLTLQGQVVQEINEPSPRLSISHLKNGLYFLLVQFEDGSGTIAKVLVQK